MRRRRGLVKTAADLPVSSVLFFLLSLLMLIVLVLLLMVVVLPVLPQQRPQQNDDDENCCLWPWPFFSSSAVGGTAGPWGENRGNRERRLEQRGQHCVLYDLLVANDHPLWELGAGGEDQREQQMAVTLAVHGTLDYAVPALVEQANSWLGPVSAALLLRPDEGRRAVEWLAGWWHCHLRALGVSVHLVWRLPFAADEEDDDGSQLDESDRRRRRRRRRCEADAEVLDGWAATVLDGLRWKSAAAIDTMCGESEVPRGVSPVPELRYPINLLRNVARLGGHPESRFQLVTDVGQVFSQRFLPAVARHVHNRQNNGTEEKVAYIVRRFEVAENVFTGTALNVSQLRALFAAEQAVPFHERFFPLGHNLGNVTDWFDWSLANGDGEENDEIKSRPFSYRNANLEPQLLVPADAPLHFEPAPARFYDHQFLVNELCHAGFQFRVLSNLFSVHRGIKTGLSDVESLVNGLSYGVATKGRVLDRFHAHLANQYGGNRTSAAPRCPHF